MSTNFTAFDVLSEVAGMVKQDKIRTTAEQHSSGGTFHASAIQSISAATTTMSAAAPRSRWRQRSYPSCKPISTCAKHTQKPLADVRSARGGANHPHKHKTISALLV